RPPSSPPFPYTTLFRSDRRPSRSTAAPVSTLRASQRSKAMLSPVMPRRRDTALPPPRSDCWLSGYGSRRREKSAHGARCAPGRWKGFSGGKPDAEIVEHASGRVVARGSDDRAGRMAACAPGVEALDRRGIGQPVREAVRVIDVVDVAARDAEVRLDLRRGERERVHHLVARPRRESVAEGEQVSHVRLLLALPGAARELV